MSDDRSIGGTGMWHGFTTRFAHSSADSDDPGLVGRTYAIPFGIVWDAAVRLTGGGLRGWATAGLDEMAGIVEARVRGVVLRLPARVVITVSLDDNAQTRVDVAAEGKHRGGDLGANARRIRRFCSALDRAVEAEPNQVLNVRIRGQRAA
ncbi:MAG: DUF1499 domain-containing protein [Gemmatimonadota bacterium]|nr:DUF1499 domain-containing protein [Gemmatimonadota bacterium]